MSRNPERRERARQLRREMTPAERVLWKHLRGSRFDGFKFRRQHPIGPFFADMAFHECRLLIELDGETHLGKEKNDDKRTLYLNQHQWLVLRFWNTQVYDDTEAVLESIYRACQDRKPPHPRPLSPEAGSRGGEDPLTPDPSPPSTGERE